MIAVVEGNIDLRLSARIEQSLALWIFANGTGCRARANAVVDFGPRFAAVMRAEQVRTHIVETHRVNGRVGSLRVKVAGVHIEDLPERLQLRRSYIVPMRAGVGRGPDETVV